MSKVYSSYRYVGQKWAAEIPEHWDAKRLKVIFSMRTERNNPVITDNILSLTAKQGVVPYAKKEGTGGNKPKDDLSKYNIARENDLLVNCMNVVSGAAGVSKYFGAISPVYYALYPRTKENVWYYHHIFRLLPFQRSLIGLGKGILMHESDSGKLNTVRMRISMDYLGNVLLPVPPRDEQDQIVRFLDWKVSEINKLISISRKKIVEYRELRKAVIDQGVLYALTHGNLNGIYCALVYELLKRFNIDGCDFLRDLINGTKNGKIMQRVMQEERDEEILKLIETNKKSNRQVLAEKLSQSDQSNLWIRNLEDELEHVHMGEETWEWFYNRHCNDRNTFKPHFEDDFIRKVYEYFQSDEYRNADADIIAGIIDK